MIQKADTSIALGLEEPEMPPADPVPVLPESSVSAALEDTSTLTSLYMEAAAYDQAQGDYSGAVTPVQGQSTVQVGTVLLVYFDVPQLSPGRYEVRFMSGETRVANSYIRVLSPSQL
jgi:hypothetical protein